MRNFAITGVGGFVAPRHLQAIQATGNRVVAAVDPHDAVGLLDRYSFDARFFTEFERFDRHLEKLRRGPEEQRVHYVSVCSPNYLHDSHVRVALRAGADAICEKPLVISPWNLDALAQIERETQRRVFTVLQLRLHPKLLALRERLQHETPSRPVEVDLAYVTPRGRWYQTSWKGAEDRSGGLVMNIGIHLFDLLQWLFGSLRRSEVHLRTPTKIAGYLELERAAVRWFLSIDRQDLPPEVAAAGGGSYRSLRMDGQGIEFTDGFTNLHDETYRAVLDGHGFGIDEARPSIEMTHQVRSLPAIANPGREHPWVRAAVMARA